MKPRASLKNFTKAFWALSRPRQEAFLKNLYDLSPKNQALFALRLGNNTAVVLENLKRDLEKETFNRIGKFKKLRLSKINEILRTADKYGLTMQEQIALKRVAWTGMLAFVVSGRRVPDRYQVATARHLDQYLKMVEDHILEKSEVEDILEAEGGQLAQWLNKGACLPEIQAVYAKWFS